ncbi:MAG: hypothetical protein V1734_00430 [Nanoarchaeota archaeon]
MKFNNGNIIEIDRELSELDKFAIDFVKVLRNHTKYVIISGYVSILLGRARASEDIDVIIPKMSQSCFLQLFKDIKANGFYCLNSHTGESAYEYLKENLALRFAKEGDVIPNMELKFAKNKIDDLTLNKTITVKLGAEELVISHLELQVAFKENVLKSPKDMEDARHIRNVAKGHLDEELIEQYGRMLNGI